MSRAEQPGQRLGGRHGVVRAGVLTPKTEKSEDMFTMLHVSHTMNQDAFKLCQGCEQ